jgi:hypothetical protein
VVIVIGKWQQHSLAAAAASLQLDASVSAVWKQELETATSLVVLETVMRWHFNYLLMLVRCNHHL